MPDLGKYATEVLAAYGVSIAVLATLIVVVGLRSRKVRRRLEQIETALNG
jgi:heme exporter protein D